ncbi:Zinc finger protein 106-like, partial [Homarus americanus]
ERPKNPAPPDALPSDPSVLHSIPHLRPLIFSPDDDFPDPPRPPPPPPPQFSPRIKVERHTPVQFMCCCMRNECERSSTHSAEMRPPSRRNGTTPQPTTERRPTPHVYKMEPPSPCASRARTPHQSLPGHFAPPASPRAGASDTRVTVGVQTEKERPLPPCDQGGNNNNNNKRQYVPNLSLARSVTPLVTIKVDQSTSTDDLGGVWEQRGKSRGKGWWWHRTGRPRNHLSQLTSISNSLSDFEFSQDTGIALQQMMVFSEQETEFVRHLENIDQEIHELMREKKRMTEELGRLQHLRIGKLQQLVKQGGATVPRGEPPALRGPCGGDPRTRRDSSSDGGDPADAGNSTATYNIENISLRYGVSKEDVRVQSTTDNASVVSSSQEKGPRVRSFSFSHTSSNDSSNESQSVRRQRCTSTCHSPGSRSHKSKETLQITYLGPINPNEEFYQQIASNIHKLQRSISNTDSETDNDAKVPEAPVESSEANAFYREDAREATSRNRSDSVSSSAEGDVESEVAVDRDEEERHGRHMSTDDGEDVVDSSQRPDKMDNESSRGESEELSLDKPREEESERLDRRGTVDRELQREGEELECSRGPGSSESGREPSSAKTFPDRSPPETCRKYGSSGANRRARSPRTYRDPGAAESNATRREPTPAETSRTTSFGETSRTTDKEEFVATPRKSCSSSPSSSPDGQKSRNSSGEHCHALRSTSGEHCYSLRSRGPPSKIKHKPPGSAETNNDSPDENSNKTAPEKIEKVGEEDHADDEREREDEDFRISPNPEGTEEGGEEKKRKRKRKTKRHRVNKRKKKKLPEKSDKSSPAGRKLPAASSTDGSLATPGKDAAENGIDADEAMESSGDEHVFVNPPAHGCAVLDIKVVGDFVVTASSDGTARCYDMASGRVMTSYVDHTDIVTCVGVVGKPGFSPESPEFQVVTGSADKTMCIFNGRTGEVKQRCDVGEGVRCLDISWGQVFLGTEGGCGARWNFKDKGVTEMVQYCGKALTSLKAMTEGGRRVLLTGNSRGHLASEADVSCLSIYKGRLIATCYDGLVRIFCL